MKIVTLARNPCTSLVCNFCYAIGNCAVGFLNHSWWFITFGAYYSVLAASRFSVLQIRRGARDDCDHGNLAGRRTGILLVVLSFCIIGVNILSAVKERGTEFHIIVMLTIALYTFGKITIAMIGMVRAKKSGSSVERTLRNISLSDAVVSVYAMQRSMLVSFPGMAAGDILLLNILTGTAVWITVLLLGINLIGGKRTEMAKAKIAKVIGKTAETVTGGYKKIEKSVVGGYKKIEEGVVSGYTKLEDKFVDAYLTKDGETVEEAKERLKKGNK